MKLGRSSHFVVLLVLISATSFAFGDPIYTGATATRDLATPPPAIVDFHAIERTQTDRWWTPSHGFSIANATMENSVLVTPVRFSERDSYKWKKNKDRKTATVNVPEPSSIQLLGLGFIGVVFAVRKFRV